MRCRAAPPAPTRPYSAAAAAAACRQPPAHARRPAQVVVVLSGSMEPGFYRGDILFLYQPREPPQTGDISAWPALPCSTVPGGGGGGGASAVCSGPES